MLIGIEANFQDLLKDCVVSWWAMCIGTCGTYHSSGIWDKQVHA